MTLKTHDCSPKTGRVGVGLEGHVSSNAKARGVPTPPLEPEIAQLHPLSRLTTLRTDLGPCSDITHYVAFSPERPVMTSLEQSVRPV